MSEKITNINIIVETLNDKLKELNKDYELAEITFLDLGGYKGKYITVKL